MGSWGTDIFSDDVAQDVREGFRELVGSGLSTEEATERLTKLPDLFEPVGDSTDTVPWIALAVAQWQTGRLLPEVRDRALRHIDAGADLDMWEEPKLRIKRAEMLKGIRTELLSPQRPPTRIPRRVPCLSPYSPGDILQYTTISGREIALWAMRNEIHQGLATTDVQTEFVIAEVGGPKLPGFDQMIAEATAALKSDRAQRSAVQLTLYRPQEAKGERWKLIGKSAFPDDCRPKRSGFRFAPVKSRSHPIDRLLEGWADKALARYLLPEN